MLLTASRIHLARAAPTLARRQFGIRQSFTKPLPLRLGHIVKARPSDDDSDTEGYEVEEEVVYEEEASDFEGYEDGEMRLYLDSADHTAWEEWAETGLFYGFTTNPTILKRDGVRCTVPAMRQLARHAFALEVEELQLQAWGTTWAELYSCGLDLAELDPRVVVKIPLTAIGARAARRLVHDGVPVTFTGVYSAHQAVTSLAAGASYVAPYLGRMNDAGKDGLVEIAKMQGIIDMCTMEGETRLLVASIRSADDIATLAAEGCNTFTISPAVAQQLLSEPLTVQAAELFQEHAAEMGALHDH